MSISPLQLNAFLPKPLRVSTLEHATYASNVLLVHCRSTYCLTSARAFITSLSDAGAPVVPPQDLASRPRRNRRSATVREAFREVRRATIKEILQLHEIALFAASGHNT